MSKPRYWWWGSIQNALRAYPRLKQQYEAPNVAVTARYAERVGLTVATRAERRKRRH